MSEDFIAAPETSTGLTTANLRLAVASPKEVEPTDPIAFIRDNAEAMAERAWEGIARDAGFENRAAMAEAISAERQTSVTDAQAEANLQTTDFEVQSPPPVLTEYYNPEVVRMLKAHCEPPSEAVFTEESGEINPEAFPEIEVRNIEDGFARDLIRRQADEILKLQKQIDATNSRLNEIFARIDKYNRGASHKL